MLSSASGPASETAGPSERQRRLTAPPSPGEHVFHKAVLGLLLGRGKPRPAARQWQGPPAAQQWNGSRGARVALLLSLTTAGHFRYCAAKVLCPVLLQGSAKPCCEGKRDGWSLTRSQVSTSRRGGGGWYPAMGARPAGDGGDDDPPVAVPEVRPPGAAGEEPRHRRPGHDGGADRGGAGPAAGGQGEAGPQPVSLGTHTTPWLIQMGVV